MALNPPDPTTTQGPPGGEHLGPIWLAPGVTRGHCIAKFYAAFISIGMLTGMSLLQSYVLTEHLGLRRGQTGGVAGDLAFWTEIVMILTMVPFGIASDRIGRRPVLVFGILMIALGYGLYPFATSVDELLVYRMFYAVGASAAASMIACLTTDYPEERSRGKMIGIGGAMNTLGVLFVSVGIARIPTLLQQWNQDPIVGGRAMFLTCALICVGSALIFQLTLKGGTPARAKDRATVSELLGSGLRAMHNPRIVLSYACAFAGRSDLVIKALFLSLWALHDAREMGLTPQVAMARFGLVSGFMAAVGLVWSPVFGFIMDRINRVTAMIIAMALAAGGYLGMGLITSPLDTSMLPAFAVLAMGSTSAIMASIGLVGQEAPLRERGSIIGVNGLFGALGILVFSKAGGIWFDEYGPAAPFVLVGAVQVGLLLAAVAVRLVAPGPEPYRGGRGKNALVLRM
jgi:MFS family permease